MISLHMFPWLKFKKKGCYMEITSKGMTTTKNPLINLMTTIYFTNHQKGQLVDFLKKYPCVIYVKNALNVNFKSLHSNKIKMSAP